MENFPNNENISEDICENAQEKTPEIIGENFPENVSENEGEATEISELRAALDEQKEEISSLSQSLFDARLRLSLLSSGAAKENLDEAAKLCGVLCIAGKTPESAAEEIISAYPHLRAVKREIPKFSASPESFADGFSAVRKIFAGRK